MKNKKHSKRPKATYRSPRPLQDRQQLPKIPPRPPKKPPRPFQDAPRGVQDRPRRPPQRLPRTALGRFGTETEKTVSDPHPEPFEIIQRTSVKRETNRQPSQDNSCSVGIPITESVFFGIPTNNLLFLKGSP